MSNKTERAMIKAIFKVLKPMVRLLMRYGVTYRTFADIARHTYIEVAEEDFALEKRKPSNARTAILTGINRKDIAKLKNKSHPLDFVEPETPNAIAKVIYAWLNNKQFQNPNGTSKELPIEDTNSEAENNEANFTDLVQQYTTDITVRALIDELTRTDTCEVNDGRIRLKVNAYVPIENMQETLRIFGTAASDLLSTMDHNIARLEPGPFLQRTVSYNNIPLEALEAIRERCTQESNTFILQMNDWLAQQDRDENKDLIGSGRHRAGIGIYYIEHPEPSNSNKESHE